MRTDWLMDEANNKDLSNDEDPSRNNDRRSKTADIFLKPLFKRKKISRLRNWVGVFAMIVLMSLAFAFAHGTFRTFKIVSSSMEPTVQIGDYLLVDARKPVRPKRGDVVAVKNPQKPLEWLCKRVVALPNDTLEYVGGFRGGYFYVNDIKLDDRWHEWSNLMSIQRFYHIEKLDDDEYFVLGDNHKESYDSRYFGTVRSKHLIGIMTRIYWPPSRAQSLRNTHALAKGLNHEN